MPAYAYPITVRRTRQTIKWEETKDFDSLSLEILQPFVGDEDFSVIQLDWQEGGGYRIGVTRSRKETIEEYAARLAREVAYMKEYNKRKKV